MATRRKQLRNNVVFIFDDSGSMDIIASTAEQVFNKMIADTVDKADESGQTTHVSQVWFGERVSVKYMHQPAAMVSRITNYNPCQSHTALFSGVKKGIEILDEVLPLKKFDDAFLVITVTDGQENYSDYLSGRGTIARTVELFREKQGEGNWTFVFMVPPGVRDTFCSRYGIPTDNVREWKQTKQAMMHMSSEVTSGIGSYYASRASGQRATKQFFVQPNLAKLTQRQVEDKLLDVTNNAHQFSLPKEEVIKDFVERKTKAPYRVGSTYYQLMKPEKVQAGKKVLLVEKGKPEVWAGSQARQMIGLPIFADAKVEPGNHANYDIFVQSTSVNRKLPRGTKIIVLDNIVCV